MRQTKSERLVELERAKVKLMDTLNEVSELIGFERDPFANMGDEMERLIRKLYADIARLSREVQLEEGP